MTLTSTTSRISYNGSGTTGPFAFPFKINAETDLLVTKRVVATGVENVLSWPADFTVTGVLNATGGTITLTTALAAGNTLYIRRKPPLTQATSIRNQGTYFPATIEDEFDRLVMQLQSLQDQMDRSVKLKETVPGGASLTELEPTAGLTVQGTGTGFAMGVVATTAIAVPGGGRTVTSPTTFLLNNAVANVKDFGAAGDWNGATGTDDTAAFQAAIATYNVANRGGRIRVPKGRYKLTGQLRLPDGMIFEGDGKSSVSGAPTSELVFTGLPVGTAPILIDGENGSGGNDVVLLNFYVTVIGAGRTANEIDVVGTSRRIQVENVIVNSTTSGAGIGFATAGGSVIQSSIQRCGAFFMAYGFWMGPLATSIWLADNYASGCSNTGYRIQGYYIGLHASAVDSSALYGYNFDGATGCGLYASGAETNGRSGIVCSNNAKAITICGYRGAANNQSGNPLVPSMISIESGADYITLIGGIDQIPAAGTLFSIGSLNTGSGIHTRFMNCISPFANPYSPSVKNSDTQNFQGLAVASANDLVLNADADYFQITGATQINRLDNGLWPGGRRVTLKFNGAPTVKHAQAAGGSFVPIMLNGATDFVAAANSTLTLVYDSTDIKWYEVSRKA